MTMHPALERAINTNASALEMIRVFTEHHSDVLSSDAPIKLPPYWDLHHSHSSFWENWQPLCRHFYWFPQQISAASECFLSIHKDFTKEIVSWLCDSKRKSNLYLIPEAPTKTKDVNENYRAHALAAICYNAHRFGLPLRDAPFQPLEIFSLSAAIAAYYPQFRRPFAKAFIDNPGVLKLPIRTCFKKLIHEPWKALQKSHSRYTSTPPVVVLRWGSSFEEELVRSICEFASSPHASSLLWIVSFNPKFKLPIQGLLDPLSFQYARPPVCYADAHMDTELMLHHRFSTLRQKHKELFAEHEVWPSKDQISDLTRIFSGAFDSIDVVEEFVDWEDDGGLKAHLETFLAYMVDSPSPSDQQPYCSIDHFYTQMFSAIPPDLLPVVKRILSAFYSGHPHWGFTTFQLASWFSLTQDAVLGVLPHLSRWAVTTPGTRNDNFVRYLDSPFFRDFLKDAKRSGRFCIPSSELRFLKYEASLHVINHSSNPTTSLKPVVQSLPKIHALWIEELMGYALNAFYCGSKEPHLEWTLLCCFDFRYLAHVDLIFHHEDFLRFLETLHAWGKKNSPGIVRVEPVCPLDRQFIEKCEGIAEPIDLEKRSWFDLRLTDPKYALLGFETETVLILLVNETPSGVESKHGGYTIYTSDMLDYM